MRQRHWQRRKIIITGWKNRLGGLALLFIAALSLLLSSAPPAYAHATLVHTDPADGVTLGETPRQLRIWFNDAIVMDFTRVELIDGDGQRISISPARRDDKASAEASIYGEKSIVLVVDLPELPPNAYRLNWQIRSEDDLHVVTGSTIFGVQRAVQTKTASEAVPLVYAPEVALRWLNFIGLVTLIGALALTRLVGIGPGSKKVHIPEASSLIRAIGQRLLRLAFYGGLLALVAGLGLLLVQGADDAGWWLIISRTTYGMRWWLGILLLGLVLPLLFWRIRRAAPLPWLNNALLKLETGLVLALVLVQGIGGHTVAGQELSVIVALVDGLHLLGAGLWVGSLLALVLIIVPMLRRGSNEAALAWMVLRRFGWVAFASIIMLTVTGLLKAGQQIASLDALLTTLYGQAMLAKIELALVVSLVGLLNLSLFHPKIADGLGKLLRRPAGWRPFGPNRLRRAITLEAIGAVGVVLVAALLSSTQPARGPEFDPTRPETPGATSQTTAAADLVVNLAVKPNRPGQNFLTFGIYNTRKPVPAPIESVVVRLRSPGAAQQELVLTAEALGNGRYQIAGGQLNTAGDWDISLTVKRPGLPDAATKLVWKVLTAPDSGTRRLVLFSNAPLAPWLNAAAIGLIMLVIIGLFRLFFKRWRSAHPVGRPALLTGLTQTPAQKE